jgi:EAL domain-containing protein (putative c-di-GMP-specific phosphodiesterase class I)/CheY-like chemotaxis protein
MNSSEPWHSAVVVDDSVVQRQHLLGVVRSLGFHSVHEAADGDAALRLVERIGPVDLLLTDLDMPGLDGIGLVRRLAQQALVRHVVVASARDPRLLETVERLAADLPQARLLGVLLKPFGVDQLQRLLQGAPAQPRPVAPASPAGAPCVADDEIEQAIVAAHFVPYVQPKVRLADGRLEGVEVLARWPHPRHGLLGPAHFIPRLEGTPRMARFTMALAAPALHALRQWQRAMPQLRMSLNLAAADLAHAGFVEALEALVARTGVAPAALTWEVTETAAMGSASLAHLAQLGLRGFGLSMDDCGIGYSSLQTLAQSPFTELKIDRAFVDGASVRPNRRAVVESFIVLARGLGIRSVAEGVEQPADWALLQALGCDLVQGFLVARPMPPEALLPWAERARLRAMAQGRQAAAAAQTT